MAVMSVLSCPLKGYWRCIIKRNCLYLSAATSGKNGIGHVRSMSSQRIMNIAPSLFQWRKFNDSLHFFMLLGIIPLSILIFCVNVFIGPAELAEIPEGYEPKQWEYYRHPIQRFFARYVYPSEQQEYEKAIHYLNEEDERREHRLLEKRVRELMSQRRDYKAWYYIPADEVRYLRYNRKESEYMWSMEGKK